MSDVKRTPKRPRGRPSQGARDAIVGAARELFVERDYDQVSTAQILERAGVSKGAMYHHFPGKRELFLAVYDASESEVVRRIAEAADPSLAPFDQIVAGCRAYLREAESSEELRRIGLTQSRAVLGWEGWREAASNYGIGLTRMVVRAAIEAGEMKPLDVDTAAQVVLGASIEAAMLVNAAEPDDRRSVREQAEAVLVDMLEGLRS